MAQGPNTPNIFHLTADTDAIRRNNNIAGMILRVIPVRIKQGALMWGGALQMFVFFINRKTIKNKVCHNEIQKDV